MKRQVFHSTNLMPFSVNNDGSNLRILPSKNVLLISGSKSGSSPINCRDGKIKTGVIHVNVSKCSHCEHDPKVVCFINKHGTIGM